MPTAPQRYCTHAGCGEFQPCAVHGKRDWRTHDAERRQGGSPYAGREWSKFRAWYLRKNPLCLDCLPRLTPATEVHHYQKVSEHPELMLVESNCRGLCKPCHSRRTQRGE